MGKMVFGFIFFWGLAGCALFLAVHTALKPETGLMTAFENPLIRYSPELSMIGWAIIGFSLPVIHGLIPIYMEKRGRKVGPYERAGLQVVLILLSAPAFVFSCVAGYCIRPGSRHVFLLGCVYLIMLSSDIVRFLSEREKARSERGGAGADRGPDLKRRRD
ncbi:hypothetical protein [Desulfonema magnum]|uniref:Lipoprotein n=1 Tax=Desulfonema magnum TaxID=45655 RepID=A0A975GJX9_9BACT|nr:hypothetical protein [Desulfonema magnum]QTA84149.1 Uncharacterized protein dnm_001420 [Desulfonema magnum]